MDDTGREPHAECVMVSASSNHYDQQDKHMNALPMFLAALILPVSFTASSVLHPVLQDPTISSCSPRGTDECALNVLYSSRGTVLNDLYPVTPPARNGGTNLVALGIHCNEGGNGYQFLQCRFLMSDHAPILSNCVLQSVESWELTPTSTCRTSTRWGPHTGAGPGGECILFVQGLAWTQSEARTIHGLLTPTQAANSGSRYCQKALPPNVKCDVVIPDEINHGTIRTTEQDTASIRGSINCGTSPRVAFIGGEKLTLGDGVTTVLSSDTSVRGTITLTSSLTTNGAAAGVYQRSTVMVVSPQ
jgi:hypothetical protein